MTRIALLCALASAPIGLGNVGLGPTSIAAAPAEPRRASTKQQNNQPLHSRVARIVLGDGRVVRGTVKFKAPKRLRLKHLKSGVRYTKEFPVEEIESVRVRKWRGRFIKRNKDGEVFEFAPHEYEVRLRSGMVLSRQGNLLPFLKTLPLQNSDGQLTIFSFWLDLRRADGSWFTGMKGSERTECHKDVLKQIEFIVPKADAHDEPDE